MQKLARWGVAMSMAVLSSLSLIGGAANAATIPPTPPPTSVTVWLQVMDSCQQALPGATFALTSKHMPTVLAGPTPGAKPLTVGSAAGNCPLQRGNCLTISTGCLVWTLAVPLKGSITYTIRQTIVPANYVGCTGGSACRIEWVTLKVSASGVVSAKTKNYYPDGKSVNWPTTGSYSGTPSDPVVFHDFGLGTGSCDGDNDADDHLTGTPSQHCDNDKDKH